MTDVRCEKCGSDDIVYVEDISCWRRVLGRKNDDGLTVIDAFYRTDGFDEEGEHPRLMCRSCDHEWAVDADALEFV